MDSAFESLRSFVSTNPLTSTIVDAANSFHERRAKLGLTNPGTIETLTKEVQRDVLLQSYQFSGLKADLTRVFSMSPLFQVSHQFALAERMEPYAFSTLYGTDQAFMQGQLDSEGQLSARLNYRIAKNLVSKTQVQMAQDGSNMLQTDTEYTGSDFTASVKMLNPSCLSGGVTGIIIGSYLQSVSPRLALGFETVWQRPGMSQGPESAVSVMGRYKTKNWIATAQLQPQGALLATYWKRLSDRVQAGVDMSLSIAPNPASGVFGGGLEKQGSTTVGVKYDFRMATFRAQVDSNGKVGCLLEKRVAPPVMFTFSADVDHVKRASKLGVGISIESGSEEQDMTQPPVMPDVPF